MGYIVRRGARINGHLITEAWLNGRFIPLMQWVIMHKGAFSAAFETAIADLASVILAHGGTVSIGVDAAQADLLDLAAVQLDTGSLGKQTVNGDGSLLAQAIDMLAAEGVLLQDGSAGMLSPPAMGLSCGAELDMIGTQLVAALYADELNVTAVLRTALPSDLSLSDADSGVLAAAGTPELAPDGTIRMDRWELPYADAEGYLVIPQSYAVAVDGEYLFIQ